MLRFTARICYCFASSPSAPDTVDRFRNFRVDKVPVAVFSAAIDETGTFEINDKFSCLLWHEFSIEGLVA